MTEILTPQIYIRARRPFVKQDEQVLALLHDVLGESVILDHRDDGAPYLVSHPELAISISHCLSAVAIALAPIGMHCGIDVEDKDVQAQRLLTRYSMTAEQQILEMSGISALILWSAKEAVYKAYSPTVISFGEDIVLISVDHEDSMMRFRLIPRDNSAPIEVEVGYVTVETEKDKFGADFDESLVLTYHFSEGMSQTQVIVLPK